MAAQTLTVAGKKFVLLPEPEYRKLCGKSKKGKGASGRSRKRRLTAQDRGDIAESLRRLEEPGEVAIEAVRKRFGL